jgi:hypothetical protein
VTTSQTETSLLIYTPSPRPYRDLQLPQYPFHDRTVCVTRCGRICIGKRKINLSQVFSGQLVGIREVEEKIWLVSFLDFDLGYFDETEGRVDPGPNPLEAKVLTMPPILCNCHDAIGYRPTTHRIWSLPCATAAR